MFPTLTEPAKSPQILQKSDVFTFEHGRACSSPKTVSLSKTLVLRAMIPTAASTATPMVASCFASGAVAVLAFGVTILPKAVGRVCSMNPTPMSAMRIPPIRRVCFLSRPMIPTTTAPPATASGSASMTVRVGHPPTITFPYDDLQRVLSIHSIPKLSLSDPVVWDSSALDGQNPTAQSEPADSPPDQRISSPNRINIIYVNSTI